MSEPVNPLPWMKRKTGTSAAYYDANGVLVSFPLNHEYLFSLVEADQEHRADAQAVLKMTEAADE